MGLSKSYSSTPNTVLLSLAPGAKFHHFCNGNGVEMEMEICTEHNTRHLVNIIQRLFIIYTVYLQ